jgi:filamentous hemagglutinin family protein
MNRNLSALLPIGLILHLAHPLAALAQITTTPQDAGTVIKAATGNPQQLNITGGTQAGSNLFHSFGQFGLNAGQTANFQSNPAIQNILGRVTGGSPSLINGRLQVTGGPSNLFLVNPAGILFGPGASLNIPAAFTATTANGVGFGNGWFNASGPNNYSQLLGSPNQLAFTTLQPGSIVNSGNLSVGAGQSLSLVGGTVINTGTITAPGGTVTIAAVPGEKLVRISQVGSLLSLALPVQGQGPNPTALVPASLPELLTGGGLNNATGITVNNGIVTLTGSGIAIPQGAAIASGQVNTSGQTGGLIQVLGNRVGVVDAQLSAAGQSGGGTILVGGDYQGKGTVPNATSTLVNANSKLNADAIVSGNGGRVVVWADGNTGFAGEISARGGAQSGSGGAVEVSGKQTLAYRGNVDVSAPRGTGGQLLLDPAIVTINAAGGSDIELSDSQILVGDGGGATYTISGSAVQTALENSNVTIEASTSIDVDDTIYAVFKANKLSLNAPVINVKAKRSITTAGDLTLQAADTIRLEGKTTVWSYRDLTLDARNALNIKDGGDILAGGNLKLLASGPTGQVKIADTVGGNPMIARSGRSQTIKGTQSVTIAALNHPESVFRSGGDLTLTSDGVVTGDGRFISDQAFAVTTLAGTAGNFQYNAQNSTGIVSAAGDVTFGDYTGKSLKIEAGGSIQGGNIKIDGANPNLTGTDADIAILSTNPALILRAGLSKLRQQPNVLPTSGELRNAPNRLAGFSTSGAPVAGTPASIVTGNIEVIGFSSASLSGNNPVPADAVILAAPGDITTGSILSRRDGGNVRLAAAQGNITVTTINAGNGGEVAIAAGGLFRATGTFPFTPLFSSTTYATSILTRTSGDAAPNTLDGKSLPGQLSITSGAQTFVAPYAPGTLPETASGTAGFAVLAGGGNGQLLSQFPSRVINTGVTPTTTTTTTNTTTTNGTTTSSTTTNGTTTNAGNSNLTLEADRQRSGQPSSTLCPPAAIAAISTRNSPQVPDRSSSTPNSPCKSDDDDAVILKILEGPKPSALLTSPGWGAAARLPTPEAFSPESSR